MKTVFNDFYIDFRNYFVAIAELFTCVFVRIGKR